MKVCIFGASSAHIDSVYVKNVEELGERLAKKGHSLVFGAGGTGLMGAAARGFKRGGGHICGVVPSFFRDDGIEQLYGECDEVIYTETMRERKAIMEDMADIFVVVPGGIGTFEEFFEVITLKQLGRHKKAIAMFNIQGYFNTLEAFMREMADKRFLAEACLKMYEYFTDADELLDYLESYSPDGGSWRKLKNTD